MNTNTIRLENHSPYRLLSWHRQRDHAPQITPPPHQPPDHLLLPRPRPAAADPATALTARAHTDALQAGDAALPRCGRLCCWPRSKGGLCGPSWV